MSTSPTRMLPITRTSPSTVVVHGHEIPAMNVRLLAEDPESLTQSFEVPLGGSRYLTVLDDLTGLIEVDVVAGGKTESYRLLQHQLVPFIQRRMLRAAA